MSYQVLARKWRPRSFREMVGQTHVLKALINALDTGRLHHAYLFTGTRGVGKTTIARIMAKCLNCEQGVTSTPCGECSICCEIDEGRFVDLIEVDAASKTKVEDTRELLDNVQYMPSRGRYKVYLIDEVHMLSTSSFNALLKTLEEPPEHVKFLLATTDPQKLPATVLSRCLQFSLKNMPPESVVGHLAHVLGQENIPFEDAALWLLGRAADGSMRDAMSLTDQAVAFGQGQVLAEDVRAMLGTLDQGQVFGVLQALVDGDAGAMLQAIRQLADHGPDWMGVLGELLGVLHRVTVAQLLPEAVDNAQGDREQILQLATALTPEDSQFYYQVALMGRRDLPLAPDARDGFEMVMLRMLAFRPASLPGAPGPRLQLAEPAAAGANQTGASNSGEAQAQASTAVAQPVAQPSAASPATTEATPAPAVAPVRQAAPAQEQAYPNASTEPSPAIAPTEQAAVEPQVASPAAEAAPAVMPEPTPQVSSAPSAEPVEPAPWEDLPQPEAAAEPETPAPAPAPVAAPAPAPAPVAELEQTPAPTAVPEPSVAPQSEPVAPASPAPPANAEPAAAPEPVTVPTEPVAAAVSNEPATAAEPAEEDDEDMLDAYADWLPQADELASLQQQQDEDSTDLRPDIAPASGLALRWIEVCEQMGLTGLTGNIVRNSSLIAEEEARWLVHLDPQHSALYSDNQRKRINDSLNKTLGHDVELQVEVQSLQAESPALHLARRRARQQADAVLSIEQDPKVQALMATFEARVQPESIRPHNPL